MAEKGTVVQESLLEISKEQQAETKEQEGNQEVIDVEGVEVEEEEVITLPALKTESFIIKQEAVIEFPDYELLKKAVEAYKEKYSNTVLLTKEDFDKASSLRTDVNNYVKELKRKRIDTINDAMEQTEKFANQMKELEELMEELSENISVPINAKKQKDKEDKEAEIITYFQKCLLEYPEVDFIMYEAIKDPKWLNATPKLPAIRKIIAERFATADKDVKLLKGSKYPSEALVEFKNNGNDAVQAIETVQRRKVAEAETNAEVTTELKEKGLAVDDNKVEKIRVTTASKHTNTQGSVSSVDKPFEIVVKLVGDEEEIYGALGLLRANYESIKFYKVEGETK